jgi:hypothetical protein
MGTDCVQGRRKAPMIRTRWDELTCFLLAGLDATILGADDGAGETR